MPSQHRNRATLTAQIQAEIAALATLAAEREVRERRLNRMLYQLGVLPEAEPEAPVLPGQTWIAQKEAARRSGVSVDTLRRHGEPAGWCRLRGRWFVEAEGLSDWMTGAYEKA